MLNHASVYLVKVVNSADLIDGDNSVTMQIFTLTIALCIRDYLTALASSCHDPVRCKSSPNYSIIMVLQCTWFMYIAAVCETVSRKNLHVSIDEYQPNL